MLENLPSIRNNDNFLPVVDKPLKEDVTFFKTKHRHPILRIAFQAFIKKVRIRWYMLNSILMIIQPLQIFEFTLMKAKFYLILIILINIL